MSGINMRGLRQVLQKFEENGRYASGTHWHIANGGYDLWWEIYYDRRPVIGCVDGCVENYCLSKADFMKAWKIIKEEYDTNDMNPLSVCNIIES